MRSQVSSFMQNGLALGRPKAGSNWYSLIMVPPRGGLLIAGKYTPVARQSETPRAAASSTKRRNASCGKGRLNR